MEGDEISDGKTAVEVARELVKSSDISKVDGPSEAPIEEPNVANANAGSTPRPQPTSDEQVPSDTDKLSLLNPDATVLDAENDDGNQDEVIF
jgi:hypothetical protein